MDANELYTQDELRDEVSRLERWVDDLQSGMWINCVYCGHRYGPNTEVPSMRDVLREHVEQCPRHPMFSLKSERDDLALLLRRALRRMKQYEMDVDQSAPRDHRQFMERATDYLNRKGLAGSPLRQGESDVKEASQGPPKTEKNITVIPDKRLRVERAIRATVEEVHPGNFVAEMVGADIFASGESVDEAIEMLQDMIVAKFWLFARLPANRLGPGPTRTLWVLRRHLQVADPLED